MGNSWNENDNENEVQQQTDESMLWDMFEDHALKKRPKVKRLNKTQVYQGTRKREIKDDGKQENSMQEEDISLFPTVAAPTEEMISVTVP
jgi:hypothetical protein